MLLALTGKSGVGKHTTAQYLEQKGWVVLDADTIAHELYEAGKPVWKKLVAAFSENVLNPDQSINRQKLHDIVFHPGAGMEPLLRLNSIVHPALREEIKKRIEALRKEEKNGVIVAALWKELGLRTIADELILIQADPKVAFERVRKRDGIDRETFLVRIKQQTTPRKIHAIIKNEGTKEDLYEAINRFLQKSS